MAHRIRPEIHIAEDRGSLGRESADWLIAELSRPTGSGKVSFVCSGGTTPEATYRELAARGRPRVDWSKIHLFWGDERCVPPHHPESNFGMTKNALLDRIEIPASNVHRIPGEASPPAKAAVAYEVELRDHFAEEGRRGLDVVLLGLGADGHTASLFPGDPVLEETERWVRHVTAPEGYFPASRITLTLPLLNQARCIVFLAAGDGKKAAVAEILDPGEGGRRDLPAARVEPRERLVWFLDRAARPEAL